MIVSVGGLAGSYELVYILCKSRLQTSVHQLEEWKCDEDSFVCVLVN